MRARVFAALDLPLPVKQILADVLAAFRDEAPRGSVRWVRPEGMHLTLKFYGEVEGGQVQALQTCLAEAAAQARPMRLELEGLGVFPHARRPQVIWVGVMGDLQHLRALQAAVDDASARLGFAREGREFRAHLTLGRVSSPLRPHELMPLLDFLKSARLPPGPLAEFEPREVVLMRSELRPNGALYTPLFAAPLGKEIASGTH